MLVCAFILQNDFEQEPHEDEKESHLCDSIKHRLIANEYDCVVCLDHLRRSDLVTVVITFS